MNTNPNALPSSTPEFTFAAGVNRIAATLGPNELGNTGQVNGPNPAPILSAIPFLPTSSIIPILITGMVITISLRTCNIQLMVLLPMRT